MRVSDIMATPVIHVSRDTPIAEVARLMLQHRISGLPVCDSGGGIIGVVTEGDLLRRAETGTEKRHRRWVEFLLGPGRLAQEYVDTHARKAGEMMSDKVVTIDGDQPIRRAVELMETRRIKRLPVTKDGRLVGIVTRANLVAALFKVLTNSTPAAETSDAEIQDVIRAEIAKQPWGPRFSVAVRVRDGVVDLEGAITDERERSALRVLAENTAGVKAVRDNVVWVEPTTGISLPAS